MRKKMTHLRATQMALHHSGGEDALILDAWEKEQLLKSNGAGAAVASNAHGDSEIILGRSAVKLLVESEHGKVVCLVINLIRFAELVELREDAAAEPAAPRCRAGVIEIHELIWLKFRLQRCCLACAL